MTFLLFFRQKAELRLIRLLFGLFFFANGVSDEVDGLLIVVGF